VDSAGAGAVDWRQRWWMVKPNYIAEKTKCRVQEDSYFKSVCECCVIKCNDKI